METDTPAADAPAVDAPVESGSEVEVAAPEADAEASGEAAAAPEAVPTPRLSQSAAGDETLEVVINQVDGTPEFDAAAGAGLDTGDSNGIVRTNDLITYNVEVRVENESAVDTTFTMVLPLGYEIDQLPAVCTGAGSSLTPASLGDPVLPVTDTSYQSLPQQTLVCNVGTRTAGSTFTYPITAKVRSEVPNGTASGNVVASAVSRDMTTPAVSEPVSSTVSSAPKWDISKNSTALQEDSGYFYTYTQECFFDSARTCANFTFSVLLSAENGGKGSSPLTGPITFTDDLTPESLYPVGTTTSPAWLAAGAGAMDKYGARLNSCGSNGVIYGSPGTRLGQGGNSTEDNTVRDSGAISCAQPGGAGTSVDVTITGADTTLQSFPSELLHPLGAALPSDRAYAVVQDFTMSIPLDAIKDFGIDDGSTQSLQMKNTYEDLDVTGLDGTPNVPGADLPENNYRTVNYQIRQPGGFIKQFVGVAGAPGNTNPLTFNPGYGWAEGPPADNLMYSGSINVAPGQTVISALIVKGSSAASNVESSAIACDAWDPSLLTLAPGDYPASSIGGTVGQKYPSNGAAVWRSGDLEADTTTGVNIQYSTGDGGVGAASSCDSGTWVDDPNDVPGGITKVSRVRIWTEQSAGSQFDINETFFSIALKVSEEATVGEIIPNWAGVMFHFGDKQSQAEMLADADNEWLESTYNPDNHSGTLGDRLIAAPAFSRVVKTVKGPGATDFSDIIPVTTGGDIVQYSLAPSLTSSAPTTEVSKAVWVEDCLPAGQVYQSASLEPTTVSTTSPADSEITCGARETYLRWNLGERVPNVAIDPIVVTVKVSPVASTGTYTNTALVSADDDLSTVAQRDDTAQIRITQPSGVKIDKVPLTPVVEVNRAEETTKDPLLWRIDLANVQAPGSLTDPDFIDVLPKNGVNGTTFAGTLAFNNATVVDGGADVSILYTKGGAIAEDPSDASNGSAGSTVWCDAPTGGNPVLGSGTSADCPSAAAEVTGLRVLREGAFESGDLISIELSMIPTGNVAGNVYVNRTFGRVDGLVLPVGPVDAPERVVASSIGDRVWEDLNSDGLQDDGEPGVAGFPVHLVGTDVDGNAVDLTTVTDANGAYLFENLASGQYQVTFDPSGLNSNSKFTLDHVGDDAAIDSDADPVTGQSQEFALGIDTQDLTLDAGLIVDRNVDIVLGKKFLGSTKLDAKNHTTVTYQLDVTNNGTAEGPYDLTDKLNYGGNIKIGEVTVENTTPGDIATNPDFDGQTDTNVVSQASIAGGATHTYLVTVEATVSTSITKVQAACKVTETESGSGFLNEAELSMNGETVTDTACGDTPRSRPGSPLPVTGGQITGIAMAALLLLAAGASVLVTRRRRAHEVV